MKGRYPTEEDQRTLTKAGDSVDDLLAKLIGERHPEAQFSIHMVRGWKEQHGFVGPATEKVLVKAPVHGKTQSIDITEQLKAACESLVAPFSETMIDLLAAVEPEFQETVRQNVILSGRGSKIRGLAGELEKALAELGGGKRPHGRGSGLRRRRRRPLDRARCRRSGLGESRRVNPDSPSENDPLGLLPEFHRSTRMPLDAVVRLHFEGTVAYQNGFAANVSALGMYVKHPDPPPVGTRLVFEFVLGEERKPVQGGGIVAWARERYDGPGRPAGVGIQFTELDALSRQHIAEALFEFLESQLGVEVADHPDVPELMAAATSRSGAHLMPSALDAAPTPPGSLPATPAGPLKLDTPPAVAMPTPLPFRVFGDEAAATDGELEPDLFTPVVPPDEPPATPYGAARSSQRSRLPALAVAALLAAGGFAGWWFLLGPGSEPAVPLAAAPAAKPAPERAAPAPLSAVPDTRATLAEAVGSTAAAANTGAEGAAAEAPAGAEPTTSEPATPTEAPAPQPAPVDTVPPAATRAGRLVDIAWNADGGGTTVTLAGDGGFPAGSYRWYEIRDDKPRVLVRLTGMSAGYKATSIAVDDALLADVRTGFHAKPEGNELHVVLDMKSAQFRVVDVTPSGTRLVIRLAPR